MRRLLILAGALALAAPPLTAQQLTATRHAPILLLPSSAARRIGAVRFGERMLLLTQANGYDRVLLPNHSVGWVDTSGLRPDEPPPATPRLALPPMRLTVAVLRQDTTGAMRDAAARRPTVVADRGGPMPGAEPADVPGPAAVVRDAAFVVQQGAPMPALMPAAAPRALAPPHAALRAEHDAACADVGRLARDGALADTAADLRTNRVDDARHHALAFADVLRLPWKGLPPRRDAWTDAQTRAVSRDEGTAVSLDGYVVAWRTDDPERTSCALPGAAGRDWHVWLVRTEAEASRRDRHRAIVVDVTPRVRQVDAGRFDLRQIERWAREGQRVRVSGRLMLDPAHPDEVGKTRGTTWEIAPVTQIAPAP